MFKYTFRYFFLTPLPVNFVLLPLGAILPPSVFLQYFLFFFLLSIPTSHLWFLTLVALYALGFEGQPSLQGSYFPSSFPTFLPDSQSLSLLSYLGGHLL